MSRKALAVAARWTRFLAASGASVLLLRFAWDATAWASERRDAVEVGAARVSRDERTEALERLNDALQSKTDDLIKLATGTATPASSSAQPSGDPAPRGTGPAAGDPPAPKRRTLFVDLGPPRSDVYVNGVSVGRTPYAGTWGCRDGDEVGIVVLPPGAAPPIRALAHCGNSIRADRSENTARELDARELALLLGDEAVGAALKEALKRRAR